MKRPSRPTSVVGGLLTFVVMFAFVGIIASCAITIGIWPGEVKLLAPLFCTDAQPDAFVVADTYSPRPGETVTNFSLYCMGPRGDATDHGFMWPFLLISVFNGVVIFGFFGLLGLIGRAGGRRRRRVSTEQSPEPVGFDDDTDDFQPTMSAPPPGSTKGPFVD